MTKKIVVALGIAGFLASAGIAFAQTTTPTTTTPVSTQKMLLQVGPAGKVLLRGTVSSVSADSVTIKSWGGDWTVNVSATAHVLPQGAAISSFQTGDFVGAQGTVDESANWTITASLIRDWTARQALHQEIKTNMQSMHQTMMESRPRILQGTVSNLDTTAQTFTLTNAGGTAYSVSLASGAKILGKNFVTIDLSKVSDGDTVRVYGTVASSTVSASIFRDVSVK